MTDNTTIIAGKYGGGIDITCILDEGAPTVSSVAYDQLGQKQTILTWASELYEGDWIAISNDTANTFAATEGLPVVEKGVNGESLIVGKIVGTPRLIKMPATTGVADTLAKRLAAKYYRVARIKMFFTGIEKAVVMHDGSNATVPGVAGTIKFNITSGYTDHKLVFDSVASGGAGAIPFHYVAAGSDGDLSDCLVGLNGALIPAVTGA